MSLSYQFAIYIVEKVEYQFLLKCLPIMTGNHLNIEKNSAYETESVEEIK